MKNRFKARYLLLLAVVPLLLPAAGAGAKPEAASTTTMPFKDARLKIEYNATDGDAGLQVFLDAEPWREISITNPQGSPVVEAEAEEVIRNYGLTELFSESSEPSFDEFPFEDFKNLFPEGPYTFRGRTIEGQKMKSTFNFTHNVPAGPVIVSPTDGSTVAPSALVVDWDPVTMPSGINVVAYEVLVVADAPSLGNPKRVLDATVPSSVSRLPIPEEFLTPGTYKAEVLAIEIGGNQTLTEVAFTVG